MTDEYTRYETGLRALLARLGRDHPRYDEALVYEQRLMETITTARRYGDNDARRSARAEVVDRLNALARDVLSVSFNALCRPAGGGERDTMNQEAPDVNLFDRISDETNLRKAWIKARYYASTSIQYFDKQAYDDFEQHLEANLIVLQQTLAEGDYSFSPLRIFEIPKGEGVRKIYFAQPKDAVVIQAIINVIGPIFEDDLSEFAFGHRLNIHETESKEVFKDWPEQFAQYEMQVRTILDEPTGTWYEISDIADFYPSINRRLLRSVIALKLKESQLLILIDRLLSVQALNLEEELETIPGLPPGPAYAHFFANLYLDKFDKFMEANTLKYFRYVDDFCFACAAQEKLEDTHRQIPKFFEGRSDQHLQLNLGKTKPRRPVSNPLLLLDHTRKLKYDLRFGVIEAIADTADVEGVKRNAETLFRNLFIRVEKEEDVSKIAKESAGFIATRLEKFIVSQEEARNIAYGLLELNPPKITAIRALLGSLINLSLADHEPRKRFIDFVRTASSLVRISCVQLLLGISSIPDDIFELLIEDLLEDDNYFVRANVYLVLKAHSYSLNLAHFRALRERENEVSEYALKHLVGCLSLVPEQQRSEIWVEIVALLDNSTVSILNTILRSLIEMLDSDLLPSHILEIVFPIIQQHPSKDIFSSILSLYLACKYGTHEMFKSSWNELEQEYGSIFSRKLVQTTAFQTIRFFVQHKRTDRLFRFSDSLAELGLSAEATVGYQEIAVQSSNPILRRQVSQKQDRLAETLVVPGLPSWYTLECDQGLFCSLSGEPEYKCRYFDDCIHSRQGTLEIVSSSRVQSEPAFQLPDSWLDYLNSLHSKDVISLIECRTLPDGQLCALYEIPDGYRTLRDWQGDEQFSHDEVAILNIALRIVELLEMTKLETGFQFLGINPCNVLWNPASKQVRFINIGSSLGVPRYVCGVSECGRPYSQKEIGVTTGSYFMGLLLLQLFSGKCPLEVLSEVDTQSSDRRSRISLADILTELGLVPHTRSIVARMLHNKPEYRYTVLSVLVDDIARILHFKREFDRVNVHLEEEEEKDVLVKLTLVDYVTFRLGVIRRNPTIFSLSPIRKTREILDRLSRDLSYYSSDELKVWRASSTWWRSRDKVPSPLIWLWINPESKHLLSVASGWSNLVQEISRDHQIEYSCDLSWLLIVWALYGELLAATQGVLMTNCDQKGITEECESFVEKIRETPKELDKFGVKLSHDLTSNPVTNTYTYQQIKEALKILQTALNSTYWHFSRDVSSLVAPFAILTLFGFEYDFLDEYGTCKFSSVSVLKLSGVKPNIWMTMKQPTAMEAEINQLTGPQSPNTTNKLDWWKTAQETFDFLHSLNPSSRRKGKLTKYSHISSPREGKVTLSQMGLHSKIEADFSEFEVFIFGDLIKSTEENVQIDILKMNGRVEISSVFGQPWLFHTLIQKKRRFQDQILRLWARWRRKIIIFIIAVICFFVTELLGLDGIEAVESYIPLRPLAVLVYFFIWFAPLSLGDMIYSNFIEKSSK